MKTLVSILLCIAFVGLFLVPDESKMIDRESYMIWFCIAKVINLIAFGFLCKLWTKLNPQKYDTYQNPNQK